MAKLVLKFDEHVLGEYPLDAEVTIGRLPDNTLVIDNPAVSGHHARVVLEGEDYIIEDLRSKNGTYVNQQHVVHEALRHRDVVLIGKHTLIFDQKASAKPMAAPRGVPTMGKTAYLNTQKHRDLLARLRAERRARTEAEASSNARAGAFLRVVGGETDHQEYRIQNGVSFIGKSDDALVRLHGLWKSETAAAIVQNDGGFTVTDFDGSTLVNNEALPDGSQQLTDGDVIEAGGLVMQFTVVGASTSEARTAAETA